MYAAIGTSIHVMHPKKFENPKTSFVPYFCANIPPYRIERRMLNKQK